MAASRSASSASVWGCPQHLVVARLLDIHVREVLGHEHGILTVQAAGSELAGIARGAGEAAGGGAQALDGHRVIVVLLGDLTDGARRARLDRRMDVVVLFLDMPDTEAEQLVELIEHPLDLVRVCAVEAAQLDHRRTEESPQALVHLCVEVDAGLLASANRERV